jgi:peptide/nickel transport system substrate-binding protein
MRRDPAGARVYVAPTDVALFLNTTQPPFDDVLVRRAVNFAIDRAKVARFGGGRQLAQPTCQILPAGFPGYAPYCPYTADASAAGGWVGPDRAQARRLIDRSGTKGMGVTVATTPDTIVPSPVARYFTGLLDGLGYRAELRVYQSSRRYFPAVADPDTAAAGVVGWIADFPAASSFFVPLFTCRAEQASAGDFVSPSHFCDPTLDARIRRAEALQATSPAAADAAWQRIDRAVTDAAPWVSLYNARSVDYLATRVGNYQRNPATGVLLDRVWVR